MRRLPVRSRRGNTHGVPRVAHPLAPWFGGVTEALADGGDGSVACSVLGRRLAHEGVDLGEALEGLRAAAKAVTGRDPSFAAVRSLSVAWSDEVQGYVHRVGCADPATGLATGAHLQERLREIWSADDLEASRWCLVVVDTSVAPQFGSLDDIWQLVQLAERMRWVFPGATITRLRAGRIAVLTQRTDDLGARVSDLHGLLEPDFARAPRVWIEGLPERIEGAALVVDELLRA